MIKRAFLRGLLGIPLGIAMGHVISIIISVIVSASTGGSAYYATPLQLIETTGSPLAAVILQTLVSALIGAISAACTVIWEMDIWSLTKKTCIFFVIISSVTLVGGIFAGWYPLNISGIAIFYVIYIAIFAVIWLIQWVVARATLKKLNESLPHNTNE